MHKRENAKIEMDGMHRTYSLVEEVMNSLSHGIGSLLGLFALIIGITYAVKTGRVAGIVGISIYGSTLVVLYAMSTIYHAL